MRTNLIVINDFYQNPDSVREFALNQEFSVRGNFPGMRTKSFLSTDAKEVIQGLVGPMNGKITDWLDSGDHAYTGSFQLCTSADRTWIHADPYNTWAGVCYLTPNAPLSGGTALYRHIASNESMQTSSPYGDDAYDYTKWEVVDRIGNVYNRLILYPGKLFHASVDYFGSNFQNGRLIQVFFFSTEY